MKTTQPHKVRQATKAIQKVISETKDGKYEKSFEIYSPPLDRNHLGKDLALRIFGGTSLNRIRNGFLYDIVTSDGTKLLVSTSSLQYQKSRSAYSAQSGISLYPAAYLKEDKIPDFVILVVFNHLTNSVDLLKSPIHKEDGTVRTTATASYSLKTLSYGKNQKYLVRSIPA